MKKRVYIPARYKSSRLPGKPLIKLAGKEMILHVCERVSEAVGISNVEVLTDDERILNVVQGAGFEASMTPEECLTGTDRIAEAVKNTDIDVAINVQGDEPLIPIDDVRRVFELADTDRVLNCYTEINSAEDLNRSTLPKVVFDEDENLLYMSRAPIPNNKELTGDSGFKQVCIYSFPVSSLENYGVGSKKTALESIEDIEILRLLEKGWKIKMLKASSTTAVDVQEDVETVESLINSSLVKVN
jgi:3-deoxy-manno-octulosonate cytidylyltransferase (CMP-KDO synthetase)